MCEGGTASLQILTSGFVESWQGERVLTADGRSFALRGPPALGDNVLPAALADALAQHQPLPTRALESALEVSQGLKDDDTLSPYLAPPPAPSKATQTSSGRVCRPRAPYWLNRWVTLCSEADAQTEAHLDTETLGQTLRHMVAYLD